MKEIDPSQTFGGLPLTVGQDATVRHYFKQCQQNRHPINSVELTAILKDMLAPPSDDGQDDFSPALSSRSLPLSAP